MKIFVYLLAVLALIIAARANVDKSVCSLAKEVGPCRGSAQNYYYNAEAKECQQFLYGGCKGNGNRFNSKEDCEKVCL